MEYRNLGVDLLDRLQDAGKIKNYGVSVEKVEEARMALGYPGVKTVQIILKRLLVGYDALFGFSLPYMMVMHPDKLKYLAGSETGAGVLVMDAAPEDTARQLREKIEDGATP